MLDAEGRILYVGKARNLKRRVASYFRKDVGSAKTAALMAQVARVEVTVVHTETEALLLEADLIKQHRPRYNVLLRDDKSYPYLHLSAHAFPRLAFYRGNRREPGRFFGPYPSTTAVRESLGFLQKLFRLRDCGDAFFSNRSRPCLQHQIGRCTAPCVGLIDAAGYARDVDDAVRFLQGRNEAVVDGLVARMDEAAAAQRYEEAAQLRDRIAKLRHVQEHQHVSGGGAEDADVIALAERRGVVALGVLYIRGGRNLGTRTLFPSAAAGAEPGEVLEAFVSQYYLDKPPPDEVVLGAELPEEALVAAWLGERAGRKVELKCRVRGTRAAWLELALRNAEHAIEQRLAEDATIRARLEALGAALGLDAVPQRIECFDVSHTQGEATVASCVVFTERGPAKAEYRRFNIAGVAAGDDYGALRQALSRRYARLKRGEAPLPDVLLIDGGPGQQAVAREVLAEHDVQGVCIVGVAKGPTRKPGLETLVLGPAAADGGDGTAMLPPDSPALHLVQQVRDEAHRFAIMGMRARRAKARVTSPLAEVAGLGPKRRAELLRRFGGLQGVARAGVEDLMQVRGVSKEIAVRIHAVLHAGGTMREDEGG
jgi:excinuclease ABC subunit C